MEIEFNENELDELERKGRYGGLIRVYRDYLRLSFRGCVRCDEIRRHFANRILAMKAEIERWSK